MRDIAKLLFGNGASQIRDLIAGDEDGGYAGSDGDGFGLAERARRAGEWCGSTPGPGRAGGALGTTPRGRRDKSL